MAVAHLMIPAVVVVFFKHVVNAFKINVTVIIVIIVIVMGANAWTVDAVLDGTVILVTDVIAILVRCVKDVTAILVMVATVTFAKDVIAMAVTAVVVIAMVVIVMAAIVMDVIAMDAT